MIEVFVVYYNSCLCIIFVLVIGRAKQAPHWGVQSRFRVIYICRYVCRVPKYIGSIMWPKHAHDQSQFWAVKTDQ